MPFLKLTPKVPAAQKAPIPPRAIAKPQKSKSVRSLDGLSEAEIEKAMEKEYLDRGALLLKFLPTAISNFQLSIDGRFGIRNHFKLKFFQLFIFKERKRVEDFSGKSYEDIKWIDGIQIHFYYNDKNPNADSQRRALADKIARHLGSELEAIIQREKAAWYALEDAENAKKLQTAIMREELDESPLSSAQGNTSSHSSENGKGETEASTPHQGDFTFEEKSREVVRAETPANELKNDFGIPLNI